MSTPFGLDLVKLPGVTAPQPYMRPAVAEVYARLRKVVLDGSGIDFLAKCGDVFREPSMVSSKPGVANRSWHKTGRTFDYDQSSSAIVIVSEPRNGKQFWRTYLKCAKQDGSQGVRLTKKDGRGQTVSAYLFDFTEAAEKLGFHRIPSWSGWSWKGSHYNYLEFWHYQYDEGLTWDAAIAQLRNVVRDHKIGQPIGPTQGHPDIVVGLNDRGAAVRSIQLRLVELKLLARNEVDGIYGAKTKAAVLAFQKRNGLSADGLVGPLTREKLFA